MIDTLRDNRIQRQRYWLNHILKCKESGQSLRAYAKANDLNRNSLYTAHSKLKTKGIIAGKKPSPKFQKLTVQRPTLLPAVKIAFPMILYPKYLKMHISAWQEAHLF